MTLPAIRAEAARIITRHGAREDQAESILRDFTAAGLNIIRPPAPVEPDTGPRAEPTPTYAEARAAIRRTPNTQEDQ